MKCIAVDFDGTLAQYEGYRGVGVYGEPVPSMVERVRGWLAEGHEVVIFTARVYGSSPYEKDAAKAERHGIEEWCLKHLGKRLGVTCNKRKSFTEIWDDRGVAVERNTGSFKKW